MERHALAFRTKPGAGPEVTRLLSNYSARRLDADDDTGLLGTAAFIKDDLVVGIMETEGDLRRAAAHISQDPGIQEVERGLLPHLAMTYDPSDPRQRAEFMAAQATTRLLHRVSPDRGTGTRHALYYPIRPGRADIAARVLTEAGDPPPRSGGTKLCSTSIFRQGDMIVRVLEIDGFIEELLRGLADSVEVHKVGRGMGELFEGRYDFTTTEGLRKFFHDNLMTTVSDGRAGQGPRRAPQRRAPRATVPSRATAASAPTAATSPSAPVL